VQGAGFELATLAKSQFRDSSTELNPFHFLSIPRLDSLHQMLCARGVRSPRSFIDILSLQCRKKLVFGFDKNYGTVHIYTSDANSKDNGWETR
jgi:hypothetical protein